MKRKVSNSGSVIRKSNQHKLFNLEQQSFGPSLSPELNAWYKKHNETQWLGGKKLNKRGNV